MKPLILAALGALGINAAAAVFFAWFAGWTGGSTAFDAAFAGLSFAKVYGFGLAALGGLLAGLALDVSLRGWRESSLRSLLRHEAPSTRTDLFYLFLSVSGLKPLLAFVFSLGSTYLAAAWIERHLALGLLRGTGPWLAFPAVCLVNSLVFYLHHRLMHTRWLWEIHKVHHSAEDMNMTTPHRNHPVDTALATVINALPAAVLGASPEVVLAYSALNAMYQQLAHSWLDWKWGWARALLISPQAHRVHHSQLEKHWNKNYGVLVFWDWLFGTLYQPAKGEPVVLGLPDGALFNSDRPFHAMWAAFRRQIRQWSAPPENRDPGSGIDRDLDSAA